MVAQISELLSSPNLGLAILFWPVLVINLTAVRSTFQEEAGHAVLIALAAILDVTYCGLVAFR